MPNRSAFTLVELLVVVTVIVILMAILAPGLDRAMNAAQSAFCGSNEHAMGIALTAWLKDHNRRYPAIRNFGTLLGNKGLSTHYESDAYDEQNRPLNRYLGYTAGPVRAAQCPSDLGDVLSYNPPGPNNTTVYNATGNCYQGYGSSYQEAFARSRWKVKAVFGKVGDPLSPSMRSSGMARTDNKILMGDWPFSGDRTIKDERTRWHETGVRKMNMLFADMHAELYEFPHGEMENPYNETREPQPSWYWW